jgi:hypothetical protein
MSRTNVDKIIDTLNNTFYIVSSIDFKGYDYEMVFHLFKSSGKMDKCYKLCADPNDVDYYEYDWFDLEYNDPEYAKRIKSFPADQMCPTCSILINSGKYNMTTRKDPHFKTHVYIDYEK